MKLRVLLQGRSDLLRFDANGQGSKMCEGESSGAIVMARQSTLEATTCT
jgi:hypothetical protein